MPDAAVFLREVVAAVAKLRPSGDTIRLIGRLLGMGDVTPLVARAEVKAKPTGDLTVSPARESASVAADGPAEFLSINVRRQAGPRQGAQPFPWVVTHPFPPVTSESDERPPVLVPLIRPLWSRAIVSSALATTTAEGEIDMQRVIDLLARQIAIEDIPRLAVPTLRRGAQLLIQTGPAMVPFSRDQEHFLGVVRPVAGRERTEVFDFAGVPTRGVFSADGSLRPYVPPLRRKPVVLLTDLGIGRGGDIVTSSEWLEFGQVVRRAGCPLIAFVPYPPVRWPRELGRAMTIIQWDRMTTVSRVRSSLARGGGGRR